MNYDEIESTPREDANFFKNTHVLITGGTGSWGRALTEKLMDLGPLLSPRKITIFSRGELNQVNMQRQFGDGTSWNGRGTPTKIEYVIGDVRDYAAVERVTRGVDYIFHLAALKHVPICEDHPQEAIKTNIDGTTNIVNAAIANNVRKVIDISTDKAVDPINLYGMTKAVGEKIIIQANNLTTETDFVCIRGGNVMGSNGSVIPFFRDQIVHGGPITITDKRMTRFFITLEEAIELILTATITSCRGLIYVLNMSSCLITDVAEVLRDDLRLVRKHIPIEEIGMRQGEKLHEVLVSKNDEQNTAFCGDYYVISPDGFNDDIRDKLRTRLGEFNPVEDFYGQFVGGYTSQTNLLDKTQVGEMLYKGGFLNTPPSREA